jgi:hypothetical protein
MFIDRQAEFLFVPADRVLEVAACEGAVPFDVPGVEFGHHGKECSFEALVSWMSRYTGPSTLRKASGPAGKVRQAGRLAATSRPPSLARMTCSSSSPE